MSAYALFAFPNIRNDTAAPSHSADTQATHRPTGSNSSSHSRIALAQSAQNSQQRTASEACHTQHTNHTPTTSLEQPQNNSTTGIRIAIKDAKLNPMRLVHAILHRSCRSTQSTATSHYNHTRNTTSVTNPVSNTSSTSVGTAGDDSVLADNSTVPASSPCRERKSLISTDVGEHADTFSNVNNDAIEFELAVTYHGRRYTVRRTMQCLVNLRTALIRELSTSKCGWLSSVTRTALRTYDHADDHNQPAINDKSRQYTRFRSTPSDTSAASSIPTTPATVDIPDLPPMMRDDQDSGSFVGKSFSMLHAVLTAYCPDIENWLSNVMSIVPHDSQSLADFLFEPVSDETHSFEFHGAVCQDTALPLKHKNSRSQLSACDLRLVPIQEGDTDDDEDDEDEYDDA